jgi:hypothetical protein
MAPEHERPTRRQIKEGRPAQQAADRLTREADRMKRRSDELGAEIDQARSDWRRKQADDDVPGAPPREGQKSANEAAYPKRYQDDEDQSRDAAQAGESGSSEAAEDDDNRSI